MAWPACLLSLVLTVLGLLLLHLNRAHPEVHAFDYGALLTVVALAASPVGAVIASRRPENPMGWIICALVSTPRSSTSRRGTPSMRC